MSISRRIGYIKCKAVGHDVSLEDEEKLYIAAPKSIVTNCSVCGKQVRATMDGDKYLVEDLGF